MQSPPDRVGQVLGNYKLVKLLGRGGYAEVYLAENIHLGVQVAIKVLKAKVLPRSEQEQFREEARLIATLDHPHIIKVLDYGIEVNQQGPDGSTPYLVMEYAPLGTLRNLYAHGTQMPLPKVASYVKQIAEALHFAHNRQREIVHRDVKPENILVRKPDDVALSDFGIAIEGLTTGNLQIQIERIMQKKAKQEDVLVPGTAPYIAPECLQGHTQRASDQYSLAIVAYEWLAGRRPFEGKSDEEICKKHLSLTPPSLHTVFTHISLGIEQVILKALEKDPGNRYRSVMEFALALESAVLDSVKPAMTVPPVKQPQPLLQDKVVIPPISPPPVVTVISPINNPPLPPSNSGAGGQSQATWGGPNLPLYQGPTPGYQPGTHTIGGVPQPEPTKEGFEGFIEELKQVVNTPLETASRVLVTDPYFLKSYQNRWFFPLGILLNLLSALIILILGWHFNALLSNALVAVVGGALSIFLLHRSMISVKRPIAITFAAAVAFWWGYVAASIASPFSSSASVPFLFFFIFFVISLSIHVWYVHNRLRGS